MAKVTPCETTSGSGTSPTEENRSGRHMGYAALKELPADGTEGDQPGPPGLGHGHRNDNGHHPSGLDASVLVLNRLYLAVHVIGVRRAFGLLFRELAEVIHLEEGSFANYDFDSWREICELRAEVKEPHDDWIRTVSFEIQVPRVIRLLRYERLPKRELHLNRRNVMARDENRCQYCARHFPSQMLSIDHVVPRSRGGITSWENLVCACLRCNIRKGGRTPQEAKMKLVRRPLKPKRNPLLLLKLENPKYVSWRTWLEGVHWDLGARD